METSFYSEDELKSMGFRSYGENVLISRKASLYSVEKISIGNNVRIDDFCILSGSISLGNYIHVAAYTALYGGNEGIVMGDYSNLSSRCAIYALSDDYSGEYMTNPMVPAEYTGVVEQKVVFGKHVIIGTGSTVLPGVCLNEGVAVGSMSLVKESLAEWGIYAGVPCKFIKKRKRDLLCKEKMLTERSI